MTRLSIIFSLLFFTPVEARPFDNDNILSAKKERWCERIIRKNGHKSVKYNKPYGKKVQRPIPSNWYLHNVKKPWLGNSDLTLVFAQVTPDGFEHRGWCTFEKAGYFEVQIRGIEFSPIVCNFPGDC